MAYDFDLRVEMPSGGTARMVVSGEIDMAVTEALSASLFGVLCSEGIHAIEVELSAVGFIDACGVGALLAARDDARGKGKTFVVRGTRGTTRRVLELTGALGALAGSSAGTG